jgi:iron(III) transport system ATP-binding protein
VVIRPESLAVVGEAGPTDGSPSIAATVTARAYYGHDQLLGLELPSGRRVHTRLSGAAHWQPGDRVHIRVEGPVTVLPVAAPA